MFGNFREIPGEYGCLEISGKAQAVFGAENSKIERLGK